MKTSPPCRMRIGIDSIVFQHPDLTQPEFLMVKLKGYYHARGKRLKRITYTDFYQSLFEWAPEEQLGSQGPVQLNYLTGVKIPNPESGGGSIWIRPCGLYLYDDFTDGDEINRRQFGQTLLHWFRDKSQPSSKRVACERLKLDPEPAAAIRKGSHATGCLWMHSAYSQVRTASHVPLDPQT